MAVLGKQVSGSVDYIDLFTAGIFKYYSEKTLQPMIGNGTMMSGAIKLGAGLMSRKFLGRGILGDAVSLGFAIDGVEDILFGLHGGLPRNNEGGW